MKSKQIDEQVIQKVYQVLDKLELRIATLEKVLQSHAKCIGELREEDVKTWTRTPIHGDETIWVSSGKGQY